MTAFTPIRRHLTYRRIIGLAAAALLGVLLGFVIAHHGAPIGFDDPVHLWLRAHRTPGWTDLALVLSSTGTGVPAYALAAVAGALACGRRRLWWRGALIGTAALGVAVLIRVAVTALMDRRRPPQPDWVVHAGGTSMPSGHADTSALLAVAFAGLLFHGTHSAVVRTVGAALLALWVAAVGTGRVYLGVHWPTDVLAGWLLATVISCALYPLLRLVLHRTTSRDTGLERNAR